ncbi:uncharacterized protein LOC132200350 [Neocloeon triangulifer]|uniref:uncharacterized protein LOC132200350 n=1 Tax=Neocloeon triangulifer TaxID=2078957 RepID=UPI00286F31D5|nr:uncharacterized protein LOC132200350 [Neocloeon triangulifer]
MLGQRQYFKFRLKPKDISRLVSTSLGHVDYDSDTHTFRSNQAVQIPEKNVSELVWRDVHKWENLPALTCRFKGKSYTYGQAQGASSAFGINISNDLNLKAGDSIGIVLPNMPEFAIIFLGAASAGLVSCTANPIHTATELSHQFTDAKVRAVVTTPDLLDKVKQALQMTPAGGGHLIVTGEENFPEGCLGYENLTKKSIKGMKKPERPDPDSLVALPYSSGTTGKPKGVMLTHRNLVTNLCQMDHPEVFLNVSKAGYPQAKQLAILPMFHMYGLHAVMNLSLFRGHHLISLPGFDPSSFIQDMKNYKPNTLSLVPPLVAFLCNSPDLTSEDLNELRLAINGAAPIPVSTAKYFIEKVNSPDFIFKFGYGLTEATCCAASFPTTLRRNKFGSCGVAIPLTEIKVADENGKSLPQGKTGELWYKGPNVMQGYINNEKATKETLTSDGWLKTGDVAYVDEDGYIFIVDRIKELIKVKGFQVSPTELEEVLRKIPGITDVAVIGVADGKSGEVPKAFVVKNDLDLNQEKIGDFLKDKVAPYKQLKGCSGRSFGLRIKPKGVSRHVSTTLGNVDYDSDTHIFRSNLTVQKPPDSPVSEFVWRDAHKWESSPALTCGIKGKSYTYGQAQGASSAFGINISNDLDLKAGDSIGIVLPNMPEFAITFLGAASAGLVSCTANPIYTATELSHQFTDAKVRAVVTTPDLLDKVKQALQMTPAGGGHLIVTGEGNVPEGCLGYENLTKKIIKGTKKPERPDPDSLAALPYSSGTTGKPKGVMLTHRNLVTNMCQCDHPEVFVNAGREGYPQAKQLAILPMFHIYGLNGIMNLALFRGHHLISLPRFEPSSFVQVMKKYKPNTVCLAPPLVAFLCKSHDLTSADLDELRVAMNGAAPVAVSIVKDLMKKVKSPDFIFKDGYGMTEVSCCSAMSPTTLKPDKFGSCGMNIPLSEIKIADKNGNSLPQGKTGELWYKGPNVMQGYLNNEKATKETLTPDGWLKTGDVAYVDEDGYIFIVDRMKELIKVKGFQVSPTELEEVLRKIPGITDVAVIGVADGKSGEVPKAFVVKNDPNVNQEQIEDFLKDKVAPYKQLKGGVQFVNAIPRSSAGKILRNELKKM